MNSNAEIGRLTDGKIQGRSINLRLAQPEDAQFILDLRLNESRNEFVSRVDSDVKKQKEWIENYKTREAAGSEYYFMIEDHAGRPVGTIRVYDYRGPSFCWGSWMLVENAPRNAAIESALLIYEFAFNHLGFQQAHFDVRRGNHRVIAFHQRFGAEVVNEDDLDLFFEYRQDAYEAARARYAKFLPS
ncbi:GNAT family N-acetyltransferase [Bordetella sp. N]|uniref:GNAT family N-acetyltransferase n=1 Tax=Bordetella sp. N TaxID=1746199 RepID=UPI00070AD646|nr:GNAT family N-acetyltransferase [Bordetella sp. N]ALM85283.1 hypothetical protein ASB57_21980 [Bordetella sp. N]